MLEAVGLASGVAVPLYRAASDRLPAIAGQRVTIPTADGRRLPAYLWRASHPSLSGRVLLIRIHGGPAAHAVNSWDPVQLALLRGIDVLALNYRGSTGYGAAFETDGDK